MTKQISKNASEIMAMDKQYVMYTYGRLPVVFVKGEGCFVYDSNGKQYIDLVAGIAVNNLGHCHPKVVEAICSQARELMHTSNLYFTPQQSELARLLVEISDMDKVFFCNSGAEANEAALKLVKKAAKSSGNENKIEIITALNSFHGRTIGAITATGQEKYQMSFTPLVPGFKYVPYNDIGALRNIVNDNTCAIMLETVQGESGVHIASNDYLKCARELCDKYNAALIFDEVQTGLGRTGKMFGYMHSGVVPDVMTLAKTLGGGFPIGACLAKGKYSEIFVPGDHASTFGGNPLACAASIASVSEIKNGGLIDNTEKMGQYLKEQFNKLPGVKEVRGLGLMIAAEFDKPVAKDLAAKALENGLILNPIGDYIIRVVPPLIITKELIDESIRIINKCM